MVPSTKDWKCKWMAAVLAAAAFWAAASLTEPFAAEKPAPAEKIDIRSDRLEVDIEGRVAEFSGRVMARQGETTIEAGRIRAYYKEGGKDSINALERIEAYENVRIRFENGLAESPEAVYNMDSRVFVLIGEGSRVTSGKSQISGNRITLHQDDGRVIVEGGSSGQVEAVFYPEEDNATPK
ncbi:MAG: hypothetical protein K9K88_13175 [Desulfobacterales bacterium]|nr:hypothetical protein [Desulfobacterales bacterium]